MNGGINPADASQVNSIFNSVMQMPPVELPFTYPGDTTSGRTPNGDFRNPFDAAARSGYSNQYKTQLYTNIRLRQQLGMLVKGLSFTTMFAFDNYSELDINHGKRENAYIANGRNEDGSLNLQLTYSGSNSLSYDRYNGGNRRVYTESALNYDTSFGKHRVSGFALFNQANMWMRLLPILPPLFRTVRVGLQAGLLIHTMINIFSNIILDTTVLKTSHQPGAMDSFLRMVQAG